MGLPTPEAPNYTHRIAISNRRILSFDGETVTFSCRNYADHNAEKTTELDAVKSGLLANRDRAINVAKARELIGSKRPLRSRTPMTDPRLCPQCRKGTMLRMAPVDPQCDRTWFDTS